MFTYEEMEMAFTAGFLSSFDGWNGESFRAFDMIPEDSHIFLAKRDEILLPKLLEKRNAS